MVENMLEEPGGRVGSSWRLVAEGRVASSLELLVVAGRVVSSLMVEVAESSDYNYSGSEGRVEGIPGIFGLEAEE